MTELQKAQVSYLKDCLASCFGSDPMYYGVDADWLANALYDQGCRKLLSEERVATDPEQIKEMADIISEDRLGRPGYFYNSHYTAMKLYNASYRKQREPRKPLHPEMRERQRGERYGDYKTLELGYNCPSCNCIVWKSDKDPFCKHCGQPLNWSEVRKAQDG